MSAQEPLTVRAESAADAAVAALNALAAGSAQRGAITVPAAGEDPCAGFPFPAAAAGVGCAGREGGALLLVSVAVARRLGPGDAGGEGELDEPALAAFSAAAGPILAAALDGGESSAPEAKLFESAAGVDELVGRTPVVAVAALTLFGEPCRLVAFFPVDPAAAEAGDIVPVDEPAIVPGLGGFGEEMLRGVSLRLWAELGRARLPVGRAVGLASGSVVELDRSVDDPVDLFVNGRRFASGSLLISDDGDWAVRIDEITAERGVSDGVDELG